MELRLSQNTQFTEAELHDLLKSTGIVELDQRDVK
jgi:hypothetical protein